MAREPLDTDTINLALTGLEGWAYVDGALRRGYEAPDFPSAIRLVAQVAELAEAADHHPDIDIRRRRVTFVLSTHDAGDQVTGRDLALAQQINAAINEQPR